ncbi:MAG: 16S rRNA (cytosine(967)-C(5))-methyltransferase RsmB [Burkholderiales bacterium]|nr:16S rRNA (cytosine(967)-C(5))-methyltransferase RsmB [Burkholderiales bacterium]
MQHEQRMAALAVCRVQDGATLPAALAAVADGAPTRGYTLVAELAYGTLRHWGRLAALKQALATRPLAEPALSALVAVALYQLDHTRSPAFAVVDRAVDAAVLLARPQAKGLVNAMLRRYLRERVALNAEVAKASPVARWSYPRWWIGRVQADHPQHWRQILEAGNERPPLTLRVNRRTTSRDALAARFAAADIATQAVGEVGLIVLAPQPVPALPGFGEGAFAVQDAGAQLAAPLLRVEDGMRVLDACAAPGGKATHLAELADIDLVAVDSDAARLPRVRENFARLKLDCPRLTILEADAADPGDWWDGRRFDRIMIDAPCTASGVVRRHPDGKWLRRKSDVSTFAEQQRRLLAGLWPTLKPRGMLLYASCSVFAAENEWQIKDFLDRNADALRESISFGADCPHVGGQLLPSGNAASHNQDGFFYALLRKA